MMRCRCGGGHTVMRRCEEWIHAQGAINEPSLRSTRSSYSSTVGLLPYSASGPSSGIHPRTQQANPLPGSVGLTIGRAAGSSSGRRISSVRSYPWTVCPWLPSTADRDDHRNPSVPGRHFTPPWAFIFTEDVSSRAPVLRAVCPAIAATVPCGSALAGASSSPVADTDHPSVFRYRVAG